MDGIDAAIITTDGHSLISSGTGHTLYYTEEFKNKIRQIIKGGGEMAVLEKELTLLHARAIDELLLISGDDRKSIDLVGFHGHTIEHRPHDGITVQIGDGALLSKLTGFNVVYDFRVDDVKSGGQGAPLVPIFHQALMLSEKLPVAILNIGGVANVTWIGGNENQLLAFDTGPGNALIDDWIKDKTGKSFDEGGNIAKQGVVDQELLSSIMNDEYFLQIPPKSLDRNHFAGIMQNFNLSSENGAATLAAFTAESILQAEKHFPEKVNKWLVAGGGRHNLAIMNYLKSRIAVPVVDIDELGLSGDMLEAQAFAFLAVRRLLGLPISFPGTTGVKKPLTGGRIILNNKYNNVNDYILI